jgi:hypothetical protein
MSNTRHAAPRRFQIVMFGHIGSIFVIASTVTGAIA